MELGITFKSIVDSSLDHVWDSPECWGSRTPRGLWICVLEEYIFGKRTSENNVPKIRLEHILPTYYGLKNTHFMLMHIQTALLSGSSGSDQMWPECRLGLEFYIDAQAPSEWAEEQLVLPTSQRQLKNYWIEICIWEHYELNFTFSLNSNIKLNTCSTILIYNFWETVNGGLFISSAL